MLAFGDVPYNPEVVADAAILYHRSVEDLRSKMQYLVDYPEVVMEYRKKAVQRIKEAYTWDAIVDGYERLFLSMMNT